jgi:hypothetical protein
MKKIFNLKIAVIFLAISNLITVYFLYSYYKEYKYSETLHLQKIEIINELTKSNIEKSDKINKLNAQLSKNEPVKKPTSHPIIDLSDLDKKNAEK